MPRHHLRHILFLIATLAFAPPGLAGDPRENGGSLLSPIKDMLLGGGKAMRAEFYYDRANKGDLAAIKKLQEIARLGDPNARNLMGVIHAQGLFGVRQDFSAALQHFQSIHRTHHVAAYNLGIMTLLGHGTQKDPKTAMELFKLSSRKHIIPQAALRIGHYYYSIGDNKQAVEWLDKARESGDIIALYYLARIFIEDDSRRDLVKARQYVDKASSARHLDSIRLNAYMNEQGIGVKTNLTQAATWKVIAHCIEYRIAPDDLHEMRIDLYGLGDEETKKIKRAARQWLERNTRDLDISLYTKTFPRFDRLRPAS